MRVAYVGNFRPAWSTENEIEKALIALGHEVVEHQEDVIDWRALPDQLDGCDFMLWTRTWHLDVDAQLDALDRIKIPTVSYHLDRYVGLDRAHQLVDEPFFHTNIMFSADGGHDAEFAAAGVNHRWLPPAVSEFECTPGRALPRWTSDVAFVGSWRWYHPEWPHRQQLVEWLRSTYGRRFRCWPRGRAIRGADLRDLYASVKVLVGDSCLADGQTHYWSDRIPETVGRGGFLVHPEVVGLSTCFESGVHLETWTLGEWDQLRHVIDHYLGHEIERRAIAEQGRAHVLAHHTYTTRMGQMIGQLVDDGLLDRSTIESTSPRSAGPAEADRARSDVGSTSTVHVTSHRMRARFVVRDDVPTDREVIDEVWRLDTYGISPLDVRGKVVVDVGANIGAFSVWAHLAGAAHVYAVEPEPSNLVMLRRNLEGRDRVTVLPYAVVGRDGDDVALVGTGGGAHRTRTPERAEITHVETITFDALISTEITGPAVVDVVKMDIEGGEFEIFESEASSHALGLVGRMVMEFHGPAMPHLSHLRGAEQFGALVAALADRGRVETFGHPGRGGIIKWTRY